MLIDSSRGNFEDLGNPFAMVCHSGKNEKLVFELIERADNLLNGYYQSYLIDLGIAAFDFWNYKEAASAVLVEDAIHGYMRRAALGINMISAEFLASAKCREELEYFTSLGRACLYRIGPLPKNHKVEIEGITGRVMLPWGDQSFADCTTEPEKAEFARVIAEDIIKWIRRIIGA